MVDDSDDRRAYSLWIAPHFYTKFGCSPIYLYPVLDIRYFILASLPNPKKEMKKERQKTLQKSYKIIG